MSEQEILRQIRQKEKEIEALILLLPKDMNSHIVVAGVVFPFYDMGSGTQTTSTAVSESINGNNEFRGTRLGRDRSKFEYNVSKLSDSEIKRLLKIFKQDFVNDVTYYDMVDGWITRKMYISDRNGTPMRVDRITKEIKIWKNVKFNFVDAGIGV